MPPFVALCLWFVSLLALLYFDPAKEPCDSKALWVPVLWLFILGSRLPSQWLAGGFGQINDEGNPLDRSIFFLLILLSIVILNSRAFNWGDFFNRNKALVVYIGFALVSVVWSDYTLVALKRWIRDLGNYLVILVAVSDVHGLAAIRTVLRRFAYLVIPLSVVLVKYYPHLGKLYSFWTGAAEFVGATTSKNMLGVACLVSGLFFFWDTVSRWPERRKRGVKKVIALNIAFIAMTWWLLNLSHSTTSTVCLVLGCVLISASRLKTFRRRPAVIKALGPMACCLYLVVSLGLGMNGQLAQAVGKDATLTDRTKIWGAVLSMHTNPLVGTGYESFWMGSRLDEFSEKSGLVGINEAHNGYLEVYLNLGIIGLALLLVFLISSYGSACKRLKFSFFATLNIAVWTALLFYSITEAGFRSGVMWLTFLLGAMNVPRRVLSRVRSALPVKIQTPETSDLVLPSQRR